ncbi:hypothetical protein QCA50_011866 [Cerrena zonata]|uniref:Uncharacterized protein n=1 Tax=Cerrena zonata TaxID=2478898 RepID=A0AAW0FVV6_9APHY
MTTFYNSYKPQVLSRTEGFHLPSPAPSTPPADLNNNSSSPTQASSSISPTTTSFDTHNLFLNPPAYLNVPETFRKFPSDHSVGGSSNMDFSEELASLMVHPTNGAAPNSSNTSHERSTVPCCSRCRPQSS